MLRLPITCCMQIAMHVLRGEIIRTKLRMRCCCLAWRSSCFRAAALTRPCARHHTQSASRWIGIGISHQIFHNLIMIIGDLKWPSSGCLSMSLHSSPRVVAQMFTTSVHPSSTERRGTKHPAFGRPDSIGIRTVGLTDYLLHGFSWLHLWSRLAIHGAVDHVL